MRNLVNFLAKHSRWLLFALLEAVSFALLFRFNNYQGSVAFTSANRAGGFIYDAAGQVTRYFGLAEANRNLTARNVQLEIEAERLAEALGRYVRDTAEIAALRRTALQGYTIREARVVNNSVTRSCNFITIDKGRDDGIRPETGVVCGNGAVGIVYLAGARHSIVLSALNAQSNISCKIKRTGYFGVLRWSGGSPQYARVEDMPRHSEVSLGDTVVTSGYSAVFPEGIPVGTVDDMEDSRDGLSRLLKVKLFTDFARLNDVCVIDPGPALEEQILLRDSAEAARTK